MIIAIIQLIHKYGISGMLKYLKQWDILDPTEEDINSLYSKVISPSDHFGDNKEEKQW